MITTLLPELKSKAVHAVSQNAPTILTVGGVIGTVTTATLTAKASFKAAKLLAEEQLTVVPDKDEPHMMRGRPPLSTTDKVKIVWPLYIPPVSVGALTITSIVGANMVSAKRAAALVAAYGVSENRLKEYRDKVTEKLTGPKKEAIETEIAQDRINANPPSGQVLVIGDGKVLCFDMLTGRYFQSTVEDIKKAENRVNSEMFHHDHASLSFFYEEIGLAPTGFTDHVGWSLQKDGQLELRLSTVLSEDNRPCVAIDFNNPPRPDYTQLY